MDDFDIAERLADDSFALTILSDLLNEPGTEAAEAERAAGSGALPERTRFTISVEREARDGDVLDLETLDLSAFRKNPVALDGHNRTAVIGRWEGLKVEQGATGPRKLTGDLVWDLGGALGAERARQVQAGILRAVSISWRSVDVVDRSKLDKADKWYAKPRKIATSWGDYEIPSRLHRSADVLEVSLVSVPADAAALAQRAAADSPMARAARMLADLRGIPAEDLATLLLSATRSPGPAGKALRSYIEGLGHQSAPAPIPAPARSPSVIDHLHAALTRGGST